MASINNLVATTETEALNAMLSAIGLAPVASIDTAVSGDAVTAKNILKKTAREVLSEGWRFNTEFGYELPPTTTQAWIGSDASTATLNVFEVPTNLIRFDVTQSSAQIGLDLVARQGRKYDPTKTIFYDRAKNRDGLDSSKYASLYLDPIWFMDWDKMPETIRQFIAVMAARRFAQEALGSETLVGFTQKDEFIAGRLAKRDQGQEDDYNMLYEWSTRSGLGYPRRQRQGGVLSNRASPRQTN
jgi:hypothetical protein